MPDVEPLVSGQRWEDMAVGSSFRTAWRTVTETDLVNFMTLFGFNEPLFWDARNAATAGYTGRLVPGALTYCVAEGLVMQTGVIHGTGMAFLQMHLDVKRPVFVGDTLCCVVEVTEARASSRPGTGIVTARNTVYNQDDEVVLIYTPVRMVKGRDVGPPSGTDAGAGTAATPRAQQEQEQQQQ